MRFQPVFQFVQLNLTTMKVPHPHVKPNLTLEQRCLYPNPAYGLYPELHSMNATRPVLGLASTSAIVDQYGSDVIRFA